MYKSKSSFLFFSVVLLTGAALFQWGGVRWEDVSLAFRIESRADVASLNDDVRIIGKQIKTAPDEFKWLWSDFRSDVLELQADAAVESEVAAERMAPLMQTR